MINTGHDGKFSIRKRLFTSNEGLARSWLTIPDEASGIQVILLFSGKLGVQIEIQFEHVDSWFSKEA